MGRKTKGLGCKPQDKRRRIGKALASSWTICSCEMQDDATTCAMQGNSR